MEFRKKKLCAHLDSVTDIKIAKNYVCEECVKTGSQWVHLRTCQTCGVTLCCDSSPNQHMSIHANEFKHPVAASAEPGERWMWCYEHGQMVQY